MMAIAEADAVDSVLADAAPSTPRTTSRSSEAGISPASGSQDDLITGGDIEDAAGEDAAGENVDDDDDDADPGDGQPDDEDLGMPTA